jgi:hypothetical protein
VIFLLVGTSPKSTLGPTQPPIQCEPGALSPEIKRLGREADHSPPSSAEVKNSWSYIPIPRLRLHGMVLGSAQGQLCLYLYLIYPVSVIPDLTTYLTVLPEKLIVT